MSDSNSNNFILYFTASWCDPCKKTRPIVEQLNLDQTSVRFFIIDIDDARDGDISMAADFGIESVPTFVLIKDNVEVSRKFGSQTLDQLEKMVASYE